MTIAEHIETIRAQLGQLSDEHADRANECLAIVEAEKVVDEIDKLFTQRLNSEKE